MALPTILSTSPLFATMLSMSGAAVVAYICKDIPKALWSFLKRQFSVSLEVSSANKGYFKLLSLLQDGGALQKVRAFSISNGMYGEDTQVCKAFSTGDFWIKYQEKHLWVHVAQKETKGKFDEFSITLVKLGRSSAFFDRLIQNISEDTLPVNTKYLRVYNYVYSNWREQTSCLKRSLDSVFLPCHNRELLQKSCDHFLKNKAFYEEHHIPYQLGILLYGPPGTGKTSIIKALATYLNKNIYSLSPSRLTDIQEALSGFSKNALLVIEDIDRVEAVHPADSQEGTAESSLKAVLTDMSTVLNAIDGLFSIPGRIMIITTNHIEAVDSALLRPGRIDIRLHVGYADQEVFDQFMQNFFGKKGGTLLRKDVTAAELQNSFLSGKGYEDFCSMYCSKA